MKKSDLQLLEKEMTATVITAIDACAALGSISPQPFRLLLTAVFKRERTSFNLARDVVAFCKHAGCKVDLYDHFRIVDVIIDLRTYPMTRYEAEYARTKLLNWKHA